MSPFPWLTDADRATLREAIRITDARPAVHVTPDTCGRCSGYGCDECLTCDRPGCKNRWHRRRT